MGKLMWVTSSWEGILGKHPLPVKAVTRLPSSSLVYSAQYKGQSSQLSHRLMGLMGDRISTTTEGSTGVVRIAFHI